MRPEGIIDALGALDEEMIAPAAADMLRDEKRRAPRALKLIAIAAAAVTAAALLLVAGLNIGRPRTPVVHPEATAETETEDRRRDPVIKPGGSRPDVAESADTEDGSGATEPETDPPVTDPPATEPTEPGYTEPAPATEPEPRETDPRKPTTQPESSEESSQTPHATPKSVDEPTPEDPPVESPGVTENEFAIMLYRAFGSPNVGNPNYQEGEAAEKWLSQTFFPENPYSITSTQGEPTGTDPIPAPGITRGVLAIDIYIMAQNVSVSLPTVRDWPGFDDVADGQWYSNAIYTVYRAGIIDPTSEHHFGVNEKVGAAEAKAAAEKFAAIVRENGTVGVTVSELCVMIHRALGTPDINWSDFTNVSGFTDLINEVDIDDETNLSSLWCYLVFAAPPDADIPTAEAFNAWKETRLKMSDLAVFLNDSFESLGIEPPVEKDWREFDDVTNGDTYFTAVMNMYRAEIIYPRSGAHFGVLNPATRIDIETAASGFAAIVRVSGVELPGE